MAVERDSGVQHRASRSASPPTARCRSSTATNRPLVTTYDWRAPVAGSIFDPNKDKYLDASVFPAQPVGILGNAPRKNSQVRVFPTLNENVSLAKTSA